MELAEQKTRNPLKLLSKPEWAGLFLILLYSFVPSFGGLIRLVELAGGPTIAPENVRALSNPLPITIHILSSFLFCIVGALQFMPNIRRKRPAAHRAIGRWIVGAGCISAASGLWMTLFYVFPQDLQGNPLFWVRIVLAPLMIAFILRAVFAIRSRDIFQHSTAMLRAYAIGQGAATQTIFGIVWMISVGTDAVGPMRDALMIGAWAINLLAAEAIIWTRLAPLRQRHG
jgi:uncharacterized membrane protein